MDRSSELPSPRSTFHYGAIFILMFVLMGAGGIGLVFVRVKPVPCVAGAVLIARSVPGVLVEEHSFGDLDTYAQYVNTQAAILTSKPLLRRVADELAGRNLALFQNSGSAGSAEAHPQDVGALLEQAVDNGSIQAVRIPNTELVEVSMCSNDLEGAKQVVNSLMQHFQMLSGMKAVERSNTSARWLADQRERLAQKILQEREQIRSLSEAYESNADHVRSALEQRLNDSLMDAWVALEQQQFTLEQDIEFLSEEETPTDVADSMAYVEQGLRDDPQLEAFAHQLATLQVELLEAQVDDPSEAEVIRRKVALLVEKQESRRQALKSELEAEFEAMANKRRSNQLEVARAQLERVNARQKALREKLSAQDATNRDTTPAASDIDNLRRRLQVDEEFLGKIDRRIGEIEIERYEPPRVAPAYPARLAGATDRRGPLAGIAVLVAALISAILTVFYGAITSRKAT